MSVLIKDVLLGKERTDIYIEGNRIAEIGSRVEAEHVIEGKGKACVPGFVNTHTHAAMTLMRGYADDMPLHEWLENKIWPLEARLNEEYVYWGTRLACLEMIKSGTTAFNDMYHFQEGAAKAVRESGMRALMGPVFLDLGDEEKRDAMIRKQKRFFSFLRSMGEKRVMGCINPHSVYAVSREGLEWCREYSEEYNLPVHIHLAETKKEVDDFFKSTGKNPVDYLDEIGMLGKKTIAAHCVWLSHSDIDTLAERGVHVAHCPVSNMKLSVGRVMPYSYMRRAGINISIGTDGCASNNNLDMFESMKFASLLHKYNTGETVASAEEIFKAATENGARALGIDAGRVEEGKLADVILLDMKNVSLVPNHNLVSNIVYSANGSCVDTVIVDGKVLMENRKIEGEEEITEKFGEVSRRFVD